MIFKVWSIKSEMERFETDNNLVSESKGRILSGNRGSAGYKKGPEDCFEKGPLSKAGLTQNIF